MAHYTANSTNSKNFSLNVNDQTLGQLIYNKWYSFDAEIIMADHTKYTLESKGFWDSKIELKDASSTLLEFKMGWKGIEIKTFYGNKEETFLLKLTGLLSSKFVLIDTEKRELVAAETNFKWSTLNYNYTIETSETFEDFENKELLLLTVLHCINYYMTVIAAA